MSPSSPNTLSFLTLNAGLLKVELFNLRIAEPAPYIHERFNHLATALLEADTDVIALQEVYKHNQQQLLVKQLAERYPFHTCKKNRWFQRMNSGLMIFSKYPLRDAQHHPFQVVPPDERLFVDKGMLFCTIDTPYFGSIRLANSHNTAGGIMWYPNRKFLEKIRNHQYRQMFNTLKKSDTHHKIALGDFNAGPEASPDNYQELLAHGYEDAWTLHRGKEDSPPTWDSKNILNIAGPHRNTPAQRIDHVLLQQDMLKNALITDAKIILNDPRVQLSNGEHVTVSDHYGMLIRITERKQD